jgi:hypothetical protein
MPGTLTQEVVQLQLLGQVVVDQTDLHIAWLEKQSCDISHRRRRYQITKWCQVCVQKATTSIGSYREQSYAKGGGSEAKFEKEKGSHSWDDGSSCVRGIP